MLILARLVRVRLREDIEKGKRNFSSVSALHHGKERLKADLSRQLNSVGAQNASTAQG